jgi:hypothetical protein
VRISRSAEIDQATRIRAPNNQLQNRLLAEGIRHDVQPPAFLAEQRPDQIRRPGSSDDVLCLRQFAFPHNALMLFVRTLDAIFELAPIVRQLFGHFVGPARHIATDCGPDVHGLANLEFMRRHRTSCLGRRFPMCAHASAMQPAPRVSARSSKPRTAKRATRIENKVRGKR